METVYIIKRLKWKTPNSIKKTAKCRFKRKYRKEGISVNEDMAECRKTPEVGTYFIKYL